MVDLYFKPDGSPRTFEAGGLGLEWADYNPDLAPMRWRLWFRGDSIGREFRGILIGGDEGRLTVGVEDEVVFEGGAFVIRIVLATPSYPGLAEFSSWGRPKVNRLRRPLGR